MHKRYLEQVQRGIDFIESRLGQPIALADVARAANLSQWHFQRIFRSITGETLKTYIRARRMAHALDALIATDQRILDIALAAGYDSQESFTRAFQQAFGMTPGAFRKIGSHHLFLKKVEIGETYLRHIAEHVSVEPTHWQPTSMHMVGVETTFYDSGSEKNNLADKLPNLWDQYVPRIGEVTRHVPGVGYGVITQTAADSDALHYLAAVEAPPDSPIPAGMVALTVKGARYAKFAHRGDPRQLDHTVNYIYGNWLPRSECWHSGGPDLEIYGEEYVPASEASVIYYAIPLTE